MSAQRTAIVRGARSEQEVSAYLPSGYRVEGSQTDDRGRLEVTIAGDDSLGWTLDDYVIPRLASGLMFADEVTS